jgi:hypothetical protein
MERGRRGLPLGLHCDGFSSVHEFGLVSWSRSSFNKSLDSHRHVGGSIVLSLAEGRASSTL